MTRDRRPGWPARAVRALRRVIGPEIDGHPGPEPGGDVDTAAGSDVEMAPAWEKPTPEARRFWRQGARPINRIIVHHSAGPADQTVAAVRAFHQDVRGWSDIGYHLCVRLAADGRWRIEPGRAMHREGAHDAGQNADSIGVCLFGDYSEADPPDAAQDALTWLLAELCALYGLDVSAIEGHRENEPPGSATICPGFDPSRLRAAVRDYHRTA